VTPDQIACIRATWNTGAPSGDRTARLFYERLFALDPSLEPLFAHVDAPRQR
jgi:hemoglobin-like flavoprotein